MDIMDRQQVSESDSAHLEAEQELGLDASTSLGLYTARMKRRTEAYEDISRICDRALDK
jgi:hypothetical protein